MSLLPGETKPSWGRRKLLAQETLYIVNIQGHCSVAILCICNFKMISHELNLWNFAYQDAFPSMQCFLFIETCLNFRLKN